MIFLLLSIVNALPVFLVFIELNEWFASIYPAVMKLSFIDLYLKYVFFFLFCIVMDVKGTSLQIRNHRHKVTDVLASKPYSVHKSRLHKCIVPYFVFLRVLLVVSSYRHATVRGI